MTTTNLEKTKSIVEQQLAVILRESSGLELERMNRSATFLELGFDSLFLIQLSQRIKRRLGVKVAFRQLIEDVATVDGLLDYLASNSPKLQETSSTAQSFSAVARPEQAQVVTNQSNRAAALPSDDGAPSPSVKNSGPSSIDPTADGKKGSINGASLTSVSTPQAGIAPSMQPPLSLPQTPPPALSHQIPSGSTVSPRFPRQPSIPVTAVEQIVMQQNELMLRHLDLLQGSRRTPDHSVIVNELPTGSSPSLCDESRGCSFSDSVTASIPICEGVDADGINSPGRLEDADAKEEASSPADVRPLDSPQSKNFERFGPYKPVRRGLAGGLTEQQQRHLDQFIQRYTHRTAKSRNHAQAHRSQFADPRGVAGYRRIWKSMVYQIVVERSKGSKLWDIDGNEYIDIAMGFGLNLFGQSPDFVTDALHRQLDRGVEVGPQTPLAGEAAALLCQFSRKDRATFCNTGSEAVMAALRLARTVTGKTKTVYFNKDYHGNFDQVLLRSAPGTVSAGSSPAAPGVPECYSDNTLVLPYGTDESLEIIRKHADEIAAVLVEPVQSADPFIQPREFLHRLRDLTKEKQIALVMDEVISGFRAAPGGAQEWYGVWGDMATYGKVLGGGMPIGALAGTAEYMDALDGGDWRYEDDSEPEADMTFFAGTFVRHPLAIAAAYEILKKVKEEGPQLQEQLTMRTTRLATTLNDFFEREQFPIRIAQFTSLFRMMFPPDLEYADMLYFHLLDRGVFTRGWGDNCFLSTAHTDEDVQRVIEAVQESCLEIREGGFFPEPEGSGNLAVRSPEKKKQLIVPLSAAPVSQQPAGQPVLSNHDRMSTVNPIQEEGDNPPLFCMPAADGLTLVYHELSHFLGPNQPVYGLDSPAIYHEPIPDTLEELAARFIEDMREIQPEGPYLLIGYCSGGTTALEVAQQLKRSGQTVALVALVETYNWRDAPSTNPTLWVQSYYQFERLKFHLLNFWLLEMKEKRRFLQSKFRSLIRRSAVWRSSVAGWFSNRSSQKARVVNMAEIWRKHDDLAEAYVPSEFPGRLVQFRPLKDYKCNLSSEYQAEDVVYHRLPVYPAGMMAAPFVRSLAAELENEIRSVIDVGDRLAVSTDSDHSESHTNLIASM